MDEYNQGNYDKHTTKNPLKRKLIDNLNIQLCELISTCQTAKGNIKILDAGCGEGFVTQTVHEFLPDADIWGIDFQSKAIEIAKERVGGVKFQQANIYQMPFADKDFDIVLCSEVLEHLEYPDSAVKEMFRVSKRYIVITVPEEPWFCIGNLLAMKNACRLGNPIDHINHWTYRGFQNYIKDIFLQNNSNFNNCQISFSKSFPWSIVLYDKTKTSDSECLL